MDIDKILHSEKIKRTASFFLFFGMVMILCLRFYSGNIRSFPSHVHAWSQADRYALALNFQKNGFDLFHPQTFNLDPQFPAKTPLQTEKGITQVDFPIHDYLVGIIMQISGHRTPFVFRFYNLLYGILGFFFLYLMILKNSDSLLKTILVLLFGLLSPVVIYYLDGFIPSIPSVANVFIGYHFYFRYLKNKNFRDLILAVGFALLAALSRLPVSLFIGAMFLQEILGFVKNKKLNLKIVLVFGLAFCILLAYFLYNRWLAKTYGSVFLTSLLPVKDFNELKENLVFIYKTWGRSYFTVFHYLLLVIGGVIFGIQRIRKQMLTEFQKNLIPQILITLAGAILFFVVMTNQFHSHDYYFLDSFYIPMILLFILFIDGIKIKFKFSLGLALLIIILFGYTAYGKCKQDMEARYAEDSGNRAQTEVNNYTDSKKYLDSLGISKEATMLVIDAYSANIPLILMDRKGYMVIGSSEENIKKYLAKTFDYIVIQNDYLLSDVVNYYPDIIKEIVPVGTNGKISVYKKQKNTKSLSEFLQIKDAVLFCSSSCPVLKDSCEAFLTGVVSCDSILQVHSESEFTDVFVKNIDDYRGKNLKLMFSADCKLKNFLKDNTDLVAMLNKDDIQVYYKSFALNQYLNDEVSAGYKKLYFMYPFQVPKNGKLSLKLYFWNNGKNDLELKNIILWLYE